MKKEDFTVAAAIAEAFGILLLVAYIAIQIYYGIAFQVPIVSLILNLLIAILFYVGFSVLSCYPHKINMIPAEICTGDVRKYSIRLIRIEKLVFIAGLLIPCISDAMGNQMKEGYSLIVIGMIILIAVYYEYRIIQLLRSRK